MRLCGRVTIESLKTRASALPVSWTMTTSVAAGLPERLRERQRVFDGTGGLHAAGLFTPDGICEMSAEDVGRHNAFDKVIGMMAVSGRASFEIVQKAWLAGIGLVCAVSAPSSLAIDLAEDAGITFLGFARGGGFNVSPTLLGCRNCEPRYLTVHLISSNLDLSTGIAVAHCIRWSAVCDNDCSSGQ